MNLKAHKTYSSSGLRSVDIRDYLKKVVTYSLLQSALSLGHLLQLFESEFHQQLGQYGLGAVIHLPFCLLFYMQVYNYLRKNITTISYLTILMIIKQKLKEVKYILNHKPQTSRLKAFLLMHIFLAQAVT